MKLGRIPEPEGHVAPKRAIKQHQKQSKHFAQVSLDMGGQGSRVKWQEEAVAVVTAAEASKQ